MIYLSRLYKVNKNREYIPLSSSTLSDILKKSEKWLESNISDVTRMPGKKKQCIKQFPLLECHLLEWVERANQNRVAAINDYVLTVAAEKL